MSSVGRYMAKIGSKGGQATGPSKRRGSAEYYKAISAKAAAARAAKRAARGGALRWACGHETAIDLEADQGTAARAELLRAFESGASCPACREAGRP